MTSKLGKLLTEQRNPNSMKLDSSSIRDILEIINREDQLIAERVAAQMDDIEKATLLVDKAFQKDWRQTLRRGCMPCPTVSRSCVTSLPGSIFVRRE